MKRGVVCLLVCVLLLHACGSAPRADAPVSETLTESTAATEYPVEPTEAYSIPEEVGTTETASETTVPQETTLTAETSSATSAPASATRAAVTTAAPSSTTQTTTKKTDYQLKAPSRVTQTSATAKETSTAKQTTTTTRSASTTTTTAAATNSGSGSGSGSGYTPSNASPTAVSTPQSDKSKTTTLRDPTQSSNQQPSGGAALTCTLTISAREIREHPEKLKTPEKIAFVPDDGYILKGLRMTFSEGETVYDVLRRACGSHPCSANCAFCQADGGRIQMESSYTPVYDSYYVEGIHQLYEKDCGGTSGWTYYVNGVFPNYGSSQYTLHDGDRIEWIYSIEEDGFE